MDEDKIDSDHLTISGKHKTQPPPNLDIEKDAVIIVTKLYGPKGDNVVGVSDVTFFGHAAITLLVKCDGKEGLVHLSPIHGDPRKKGFVDVPMGARCELFCPVSKQPLDWVADAEDDSGARYYALYLTEKMSKGSMVAISDIWGHYHSRIIDEFELISQFAGKDEDLKP